MSTILNLSNKITLSKNIRERISESEAGFIRSELTGAITYTIDCDFPLMSYNDFLDFQGEILSIDNGVSFYYISIPEKAKLTPFRGLIEVAPGAGPYDITRAYNVDDVWSYGGQWWLMDAPNIPAGYTHDELRALNYIDNTDEPTPIALQFVFTGDHPTQGSTVTIANCGSNSNVRAGDFIQFGTTANKGKVYQVKQDSFVDQSGFLTFTLTQGVVKDILSTDEIYTGSNVTFKTKLSQNPSYTSVPKNNNENLYLIDSITLTESL